MMNNFERRVLINFLNEFKKIESCKLIYKASNDKMKFHAICDNIHNTVTVINVAGEFIFGGFTTNSWDDHSSYKEDKDAFIFSLKNSVKIPSKIEIKNDQKEFAIFCSPIKGPSFGIHEIDITLDKNIEISGSSKLGFVYSYIEESNFSDYLAGASDFYSFDIEVFSIVFE